MSTYEAPTLPSDLAAERAMLGCLFRSATALERIGEWFSADMCYLLRHEHIYAAALALAARHEPVDRTTVASELQARDQLEGIGGESYLVELMATVPHAAHVEHYARTVKNTAILRRIIEAGGEVAALGYDRSRPLEAVIADAEQALTGATSAHAPRDQAVALRAVMDGLLPTLNAAQGRGGLTGLSTGYHELDSLTGGLQNSDLIILAARPSIGKTSLALSLAYNVAVPTNADGGAVGVFSLEMGREQLGQRLLALQTGIDLQRLRNGDLDADELNCAVQGMAALGHLPIVIDDAAGLSISDLQRRARRMHAKHQLSLLVVDYLQLMGAGKHENRVQEVSEISRGLKVLAKDLNIPIVALSQLSRAVEGRQSKVPMLSDLRESGSIEQDADIVIFIYRDEVYDKDTEQKGVAELHIAKHRNGPVGVVPLRFEARTTKFHNLERWRSPEGY